MRLSAMRKQIDKFDPRVNYTAPEITYSLAVLNMDKEDLERLAGKMFLAGCPSSEFIRIERYYKTLNMAAKYKLNYWQVFVDEGIQNLIDKYGQK